jgi:hypothetical protein
MRHSWLKLRAHTYICRKCGMGKVNQERGPNDWVQLWSFPTVPKPEQQQLEKTPPCEPGPDTARRLQAVSELEARLAANSQQPMLPVPHA